MVGEVGGNGLGDEVEDAGVLLAAGFDCGEGMRLLIRWLGFDFRLVFGTLIRAFPQKCCRPADGSLNEHRV